MDPVVSAVLGSWTIDPLPTGGLSAMALLYLNGWKTLNRELPHKYSVERLLSFLAGLSLLFVAIASPLDAFAGLLLQVHMVQHLLLMVVVPVLLWMGQPVIPLLRGLPGSVLKRALGPFLSWPILRRAGRILANPIVCWLTMAFTLIFWHQPRLYELALRSPDWHRLEHACFLFAALLFWCPVIGVWPARAQGSNWLLIPYLVFADILNTALSAWLVFSRHVVYPTYESAPRLWDISALDDQSAAGALMWVPGSLAYLIPAFLITMRALQSSPAVSNKVRTAPPAVFHRPMVWDLLRVRFVGPVLRHPRFTTALQTAAFIAAAGVMLDGFISRDLPAPLTLAGVLPWTYFRSLGMVVLVVSGNLVCMACPFTFPRRLASRWLPGSVRWPSQLRSKWLATALLAACFLAYEVFRPWDSPFITAWIVVGYFVVSFATDGIFGPATFCRYVCPVGQFQFINSLASPLEVRAHSATVCASCTTHDCIRGNSLARGCAMQLFQPVKTGNLDCTFCLDCVTACPSANVGILPASQATGTAHNVRLDSASLACLVVSAGLVSASVMTAPVMAWIHHIQTVIGTASWAAVVTACYGLGFLIPQTALLVAGKKAARFVISMVPLGAAMWTAHLGWHFITGWHALSPVLGRLAGYSWASQSAVAPVWLTGVQILILDAGFIITVARLWKSAGRSMSRAYPWALVAIAYFAAGIWVLLQSMEMRGMVMNS